MAQDLIATLWIEICVMNHQTRVEGWKKTNTPVTSIYLRHLALPFTNLPYWHLLVSLQWYWSSLMMHLWSPSHCFSSPVIMFTGEKTPCIPSSLASSSQVVLELLVAPGPSQWPIPVSEVFKPSPERLHAPTQSAMVSSRGSDN